MFTTDERMIAGVKAMYPAGTKIVLDSMGDDPRPIPPGTKGIKAQIENIVDGHFSFLAIISAIKDRIIELKKSAAVSLKFIFRHR